MKVSCLEVAQAAALKPGRKVGKEVLFTCPRHDDAHPSLSINPTKDVWMCGPCAKDGTAWSLAAFINGLDPDDKEGVTAWFEEKGLLNGNHPPGSAVATYDYKDENNKLLYQIVRYKPKTFRARRPDGKGGWISNAEGVPRVPYRLPDWKDNTVVYIPEGEKDVDTLISLNLPATCNPYGARKWRQEYNHWFSGKMVAILPDNDKEGEEHGRGIARNLFPVAKVVRIVYLPGLPKKGDVSDFIAAGGTRENLVEIVKATPNLTDAEINSWPLEEEDPPPRTEKQGASSDTATEINWPESRGQLPALLPEAPSLPPKMLPEGFRQFCQDVSERMEVPLEFIAGPTIVAAATVIGRAIGIYPKRQDIGWLEPANLWGALVARPGLLKTPAIEAAFKPLKRLTAAASEEFLKDQMAALAAQEVHKLRIADMQDTIKQAVKKGDPTSLLQAELADLMDQGRQLEVHERRYMVNDSTVEKLGELFRQNPRGLMISRDELAGWMRGLEKSGKEGDREFYLEGWGGRGSFTWDRIGRGTIHVPALCMSFFGGIQPGKLLVYVADAVDGGIGDDGLLQRFQITIYPEPPKIFRGIDRCPDYAAEERVFRIFEYLDAINAETLGAVADQSRSIPALHFSPDAQDLFDEWRQKLEVRLRSETIESPSFESHLAKYRGLMPRLALIFQLVDWAAGAEVSGSVGLKAASMAADWCEFLEAHARKVYAGAIQSDVYAAHALARKIKEGKVRDGATVREIYRNEWSQLRKKEHVFEALTILSDAGWVRLEQDKREGRPSDVVRLHPSLRRSDDTVRSEVA